MNGLQLEVLLVTRKSTRGEASINQINDIVSDNQNKTFDDFESDFLDFSEEVINFGDIS